MRFCEALVLLLRLLPIYWPFAFFVLVERVSIIDAMCRLPTGLTMVVCVRFVSVDTGGMATL